MTLNQAAFGVLVCVPHSTCLTFSQATACMAVSSTNSFPALSLPDPPSAENRAPEPVRSQAKTFTESPAWLHVFIPPLAQPRNSRNCMLTVVKTPQSPRNDIWVRASSPVCSLPSCTVHCHLQECEKTRPLIVLVRHTWRLTYSSKQGPPPLGNSIDTASAFTWHLIRYFWAHRLSQFLFPIPTSFD